MAPELTLHALAPSHPCMTVAAALDYKGLPYERIDFTPGEHVEKMQAIYGEGSWTVPGLVVDGEPVHRSCAILERLEAIAPEPTLYPMAQTREAELWGDSELQDLGRRLPWGALHFRPEAIGTFTGGEPLDGAGTDFAIGFVHNSWQYHKVSAARLQEDLAGLPAKLAHIEQLADDGLIGAEQPTAADFQIGATIRVLLTVGDLQPLLAGSAGEQIALRHFPRYPGEIPPGAYPAGWTPSA